MLLNAVAPIEAHSKTTRSGLAVYQALAVDLTAIPLIATDTALTFAAEVGHDLSRFPDMEHFTSWLTVAPGTRTSAGKPLGRGHKRNPVNRVGQALKLVSANARRSDSYIGASHRARLRRLESAKAIKATAHQIARIIYAMLTKGQPYVERGIEAHEHEHKARQLHALQRRARALGMTLLPAEPVLV